MYNQTTSDVEVRCSREQGKSDLDVDVVVPNAVHWAVAESASPQEALGLVVREPDDFRREEPADTLRARRSGKRALVGPELLVVLGLLDEKVQVQLNSLKSVVAEDIRKLEWLKLSVESRAGGVDSWASEVEVVVIILALAIKEEADNRTRNAGVVVVHEVNFAFWSVAIDSVLGCGVHVPLSEVSNLWIAVMVELDVSSGLVVVIDFDRELRTKVPVVNLSRQVLGVVESGRLLGIVTPFASEVDGRLSSARVASAPLCVEESVVVK